MLFGVFSTRSEKNVFFIYKIQGLETRDSKLEIGIFRFIFLFFLDFWWISWIFSGFFVDFISVTKRSISCCIKIHEKIHETIHATIHNTIHETIHEQIHETIHEKIHEASRRPRELPGSSQEAPRKLPEAPFGSHLGGIGELRGRGGPS